ncbi:hypothetical protein L1049_024725 [Liquidambar formosana]|uniref:Vacuolar protein sorting-associated protein 13 VPS13 adaptor binding domain-containing protein n=1 Tax=Liquidambar formosana TaxID=63359 RepID=A0AAP0S2G1_LIQFO
MVFNELFQRRLVSLLRPWLREEPELELNLGFLRSHSIAKNLRFDTSVLNQLIDDPTRLSFKDVTIEHVSIRMSNWSVPAFTIEVRGVHVVLSVGERTEGSVEWMQKSIDTSLDDTKKTLSVLDPEGSALHDLLERISDTTSRNWIRTSLLNLIIKHCRLQMHGIHLQVQFPFSDDSFMCMSEAIELNAESKYLEHGCFLRGLIGAIILPSKESSFTLDGRGFEIGLKRNGHVNCVIPSTDMSTSIKLKDLQLVHFNLCVPELNFSFSPVDLTLILAFDKFLSKESKRVRNGRQLWKLARCRIGYLILTPRFSLHKIVGVVGLWVRYVNTYKHLLLLVGYSADNSLKKSAVKVSGDKRFSRSVKHYWKVISDVERELPPETIVQARRIARYRAALNVRGTEDSYTTSLVNGHFEFFRRILPLPSFIWKIICIIFHSLVNFFHLRKFLAKHPRIDAHLGITSEESCPRHCLGLNLGKISITISPINAVQPPFNEKMGSHVGISHLDLRSFCISIDALFLIYMEDLCEQSLSISSGHLKVMSSVNGAPVRKSSSKNFFNSSKGHWQERIDDSETILWSEPVQMFLLPKNCRTGTAKHSEGACVSFLENVLGEMWVSWKRSCMIFEETEIQYLENPCLLFEIKNFLTDSGLLKEPDSGFQKCGLTVGKLNFALGYSSILSIALLFRQVQNALCWTEDSGSARVLPNSPRSFEDPPEISWDNIYNLYASRMKTAVLRMLPEKHIQLGVLIAGPHIQMSLRKEFHAGNEDMNYVTSQDDFHLIFDVHNIEVAVWPTLGSDLASSTGYPGLDDVKSECCRLKEPQIIDIPKSDDEIYISQGQISLGFYLRVNGLNAYLEDSEKNQQFQVLKLMPMTVQLSNVRKYLHSFSSTVVAFSTSFCGMARGFTVLLYMDELSVFFQVVVGLYSAVSYAFTSLDSHGSVQYQELLRQEIMFAKPENQITARGAPLISKSSLFVINGTFDLKSMDIILHTSRKCTNVEIFLKTFDALSIKKLAEYDMPDYGTLFSVQKICAEIFCDEGKAEVFTDLSGIHSVIFRYHSQIGKSTDLSDLRILVLQSLNCLCEMSLSYCLFTLWLGSPQNASSTGNVSSGSDCSPSGCKTLYTERNSPSTIVTERSSVHSFNFDQKIGFASTIVAPASYWLLINIALSEIFIVRCSVKTVLLKAHQLNKLLSSLYVGGEFQTISWGVQGAYIFLETTALVMLVRCFASYHHCVTNILSVVPSSEKNCEEAEPGVNMTEVNDNSIERDPQGRLNTSQQAKWEMLEAFTMDLTQFSLVLVVEDESGAFRELVLEVDVCLNLELANMRRFFLFDLSRLSILSQILHESEENEVQIPHFSSVKSNDLSSDFVSGDSTVAFLHRDANWSVFDDASCSSGPISQKEAFGNNCVSQLSRLSHQSYILKQLRAIISAEKSVPGSENSPLFLNHVWVGSGSVSGFDMTISLSEILMVLSMDVSFSGVFSKDTASDMKQRHWNNNQESNKSWEETVPNGAIVAIQDVHQHMYFAIESVENKYSLVGTNHYSLVGERALFRVKYDTQRKWKLPVLWFSLISLHAKSDSGEPLQLNYRPGSGFVDISSTTDPKWALWRTLSYKPESYEGDIDWEPYNQLAKNTFYLVNKKNDCAVAFVDGLPEFVRKPGNPFKFKVFRDLPLARDVLKLDSRSVEASGTNLQHSPHVDKERAYMQAGILPRIDLTIDNVTLTIVHELSNTRDKAPLIRGCINNIQLIIQILSSKVRVISTLIAVLTYFDAQRNLWRELVPPVEICIFYRSSFQIQASEIVLDGVPVHAYFRIKELDIFLTELSLDILLFVIGKLDLAGPYSVRSYVILANCCKVENQSGLDLLCHFYDNQDLTIARKQSASIFLRHSALADQPSEKALFLSIQLAVIGAFSTSPIHLSLLEAQAFAWRTRIVSLEDSKAYPGPFLVVDISRKTEDGLMIVVSPLIKIHNETEFSMELRFRRPQQKEAEFASVFVKSGDTIDDSMAVFDAVNLSGGIKKALMSLSVGNFLFSFRPEITDGLRNFKKSPSVEWSDDLKGGKAVRLSGLFDKLTYRVRKAFSVEPVKCSFSTAHCSLKSADEVVSNMHFLIQIIGRDVPVIQPDKVGNAPDNRNSPIALQEKKEIFILPTVRVSNLLLSEIHVLLTETDPCASICHDNIGNQATIPCGSTIDLYANPAIIYFTVTLTAFNSSCKPVNSGDWVRRLHKQKDVNCLDIGLDFGGKYFASLRLSRGHRGILEAAIFTSYTLKNETDFPLFSFPANQKHLSWDEAQKFGSSIPPELGLFLPPKSNGSWFLKSNKVNLKLLEEKPSEALLDLDALSGFTEISLEREEAPGFKYITKLGLSLGPCSSKVVVPSQTVTMVPRYIVVNESKEVIIVRQCYLEDDMEGMIRISSGQKTTLQLQNRIIKRRQIGFFDNFVRKHRNANDDSLLYIQFQLNETGFGWSGPVCIASLGRFFLKFRKSLDSVQQPNQITGQDNSLMEFAAVHVVEEEPEVLGSESSVDYVWDDLTFPHKLVVQINDMPLLREINLDKVRPWKPLFKIRQQRGLAFPLPLDKRPRDKRRFNFGESNGIETVNMGYEVYADGLTRVLRICEFPESHKGDTVFQSSAKIQLRFSCFATHFLEHGKQDVDENEPSFYTPIIVARLVNITLDSLVTDQLKYNQIRVQSLNVDQKWVGAPFASMLQRHQSDFSDTNDCILHIAFILLSTTSNVKQVKYSSIVLQPVDLNLDEETLMRIVPFWRTSLSDSNTQSQQFYFDHFEIHPIKIPAIKHMVVELNGVLVTHALITMRELYIKCGQHYSWYAMRAIYIMKGSPLLPPAFASIFDDLASSSLDVFFDPSHGLISLPGLTVGTFKLISKCIDGKGFSGTKRYFGDLGKTLRTAGSNVLFAAVTQISDSVLKGAETSGFNGMVSGFHQGILKLAMEPSLLGNALMEGGPDRKIKLDQSPGVDELYIEGYLQAMLDTIYKQEYLRVRVIDNQVFLKNLPPNSSLIDEIMDRVKGFLISEALLKGDSSTSRPLRHLRGGSEWKIGPTVLTLCEHLFVSFAIRILRKQAGKFLSKIKLKEISRIKWNKKSEGDEHKAIVPATTTEEKPKEKFLLKWEIGKFALSGLVAYVDGRLCRSIPHPIARRIVSGFLLSFLDNNDKR